MNLLGLPACLELVTDVAQAQAVVDRLWPWDREGGVRIGSFMPDGFEAYARIPHPVMRGAVYVARWSDLSGGRPIGAEDGFAAVTGMDDSSERRRLVGEPLLGRLMPAALATLGAVLGRFTGSADRCSYLFWSGWGSWHHGAFSTLTPGSGSRGRRRMEQWETEENAAIARIPLVRAQHREYFLFRGPLSCTRSMVFRDRFEQSPSLWWPEDFAWCVMTEVDAYSTYLGATGRCIEEVSRYLEALPVRLDNRLGPDV